MSDHIPDEWVAKGREAFTQELRDHGIDYGADWTVEIRTTLAAVAPLIAAQALRDAASAPLCANVPDGGRGFTAAEFAESCCGNCPGPCYVDGVLGS